MKILSLFDGMACGALALQAAGIEVEKYMAYEVDKYAIQTAKHNFQFIEERGDVFKADFSEYTGFDYLIGGSPCTYWSIAQTKNRETVASGMGWELYSQYVRALHEAKPRYFLYENNKSMSAEIRASITETFGFEPILINSALVSAQNRQRLYWCGIRQADGTYKKADIQQPADRGILLKDILETGYAFFDKSYTLAGSYYKGPGNDIPRMIGDRSQSGDRALVAEPVIIESNKCVSESITKIVEKKGYFPEMFNPYNRAEITNKSPTVTVSCDHLTTSSAVLIVEPIACRLRGRTDKNGSGYGKYECRNDRKANALDTNVTNGAMVAEPVNITKDWKAGTLMAAEPINAMKYELKSVENKDAGVVGVLDMAGQEQIKRVYGTNGKCATLTTCQGGHREPKVFEKIAEPLRVNEATKAGYTEIQAGNCVDMAQPNSKTRRGRNMENKSNCLQTTNEFYQYCGSIDAPIYEEKDGYITVKGKQYPIKLVDGFYVIRKLTVRECMRLQTVPDWYEWPVSKSQAYKMLGNGWTVDVIAHILRCMK